MGESPAGYAGMWLEPSQDRRTYGNPQGEKATYRAYLANYRWTLTMKCEGLTPEQLAARSVPPSNLSLLGLVRHMASVEHNWFSRVARASGAERLYRSEDDHDLDFNGTVGTTACVADAFGTWNREVADAEKWFAAVPESGLGRELSFPRGESTVGIRDLMVHMIEEYARHCGHADLLRECVDGRTGR